MINSLYNFFLTAKLQHSQINTKQLTTNYNYYSNYIISLERDNTGELKERKPAVTM